MAYVHSSSIRPRVNSRRGETAVVQRVRVIRGAPVPSQLGSILAQLQKGIINKQVSPQFQVTGKESPSEAMAKLRAATAAGEIKRGSTWGGFIDAGHAVGKALDNKVVKGVTAGALALTGVGAPVAAGIMATQGAAGAILKPGGNIGRAAKAGAVGGAVGAASGIAGKYLHKVPGVTTLREKLGINTKTAPSYDSDSRLDALASQTAPKVSQLPSNTTLTPITQTARPVLKRGSDLLTTATGVASTAATAIPEKSVIEKLIERAKREAKKLAEQKATELAVGVSVPPSANPVVPQGGFPAEPMPFSPAAEIPVQQAGVGGGVEELFKNPIALGAIAITLVMLSGKRR